MRSGIGGTPVGGGGESGGGGGGGGEIGGVGDGGGWCVAVTVAAKEEVAVVNGTVSGTCGVRVWLFA